MRVVSFASCFCGHPAEKTMRIRGERKREKEIFETTREEDVGRIRLSATLSLLLLRCLNRLPLSCLNFPQWQNDPEIKQFQFLWLHSREDNFMNTKIYYSNSQIISKSIEIWESPALSLLSSPDRAVNLNLWPRQRPIFFQLHFPRRIESVWAAAVTSWISICVVALKDVAETKKEEDRERKSSVSCQPLTFNSLWGPWDMGKGASEGDKRGKNDDDAKWLLFLLASSFFSIVCK